MQLEKRKKTERQHRRSRSSARWAYRRILWFVTIYICVLLLENGIFTKTCVSLYVLHWAFRDAAFGHGDIHDDEDKDRAKAHPMDLRFVASNERLQAVAKLTPFLDVTRGDQDGSLDEPWSGPVIDVLSVGTMTRPHYLHAQLSTWAAHRSVRSFWGFTEQQDHNLTCHEMSSREVIEHVHKCRAFEGWSDSVHRFVYAGFGVAESGVFESNEHQDSGWFCAQRRIGRAFGWLEQLFAQRSVELPDFLLLVDDDTYFDLESLDRFVTNIGLEKRQPNMISGCMFRRSGYIQWNFPYGGFGAVYTRGAIENLVRPIFCNTPTGGMDKFTKRACMNLQKNRIGERALFKEGMNIAKLFFYYSGLRLMCFHSDWIQGYVAEFYIVEEKWQNNDKHAMGIWPNDCGNITKKCVPGLSSCHRQPPEAMEYFARQAYNKSPRSYHRKPILPEDVRKVIASTSVVVVENKQVAGESSDSRQKKTLWMYWSQGIEHLESLAGTDSKYAMDAYCVQAWKKLNPNWDVRVLDKKSAAELAPKFRRIVNDSSGRIDNMKGADLLRLELLTLYGGVWSDTSICPMRPLDEFLPALVKQFGFFTPVLTGENFAGDKSGQKLQQFENCHTEPDTDLGLAETRSNDMWFLATEEPHHVIMERWLEAFYDRLLSIVTAPTAPVIPYYVAHCTFTQVRIHDPEVEEMWTKFERKLGKNGHYWAEGNVIGICYGGVDCDSDVCSASAAAVEYAKDRCFFVKRQAGAFADFVRSSAYTQYLGSF